MTALRPAPRNVQGLPTLTEVIELPLPARAPAHEDGPPTVATEVPVLAPGATPADHPGVDEEQLVSRVAHEVTRQADRLLEHRLREAIEPALAQAAEVLLRDLRAELSASLHELVSSSVRQELERQIGR